jgi:hypothetical protein
MSTVLTSSTKHPYHATPKKKPLACYSRSSLAQSLVPKHHSKWMGPCITTPPTTAQPITYHTQPTQTSQKLSMVQQQIQRQNIGGSMGASKALQRRTPGSQRASQFRKGLKPMPSQLTPQFQICFRSHRIKHLRYAKPNKTTQNHSVQRGKEAAQLWWIGDGKR